MGGKIEVISGPMFCGKSEELIRRIRRIQIAKIPFQCFKPSIDTRYELNHLCSHDRPDSKTIKLEQIDSIKDLIGKINKDTKVIAIDEVQFLGDEKGLDKNKDNIIDTLRHIAYDRDIHILVAGLDKDFRGEPFTFMGPLLAIADDVTKLKAVCKKCYNPEATRTQRTINQKPAPYNSPVILVGEKDFYEARCSKCHEVPGKPHILQKKLKKE
jgi:thymidine kinase